MAARTRDRKRQKPPEPWMHPMLKRAKELVARGAPTRLAFRQAIRESNSKDKRVH
jgi:hypothetical protein